jgi:hypothetical protein
MCFLEEYEREATCAALDFPLADLPQDVDDGLHEPLPGQIGQAGNIDHQRPTLADFVVLGLQRCGFIWALGKHPRIARCFQAAANGRAYHFVRGKFQIVGHLQKVLDADKRHLPTLLLGIPGFLKQA